MAGIDIPKGFGRKIRSSKLFIYTVINLAVFIDAYIYGLIIPVLPFALVERVNLPEREVQQWIGILLGAYGAGLIVGARTFYGVFFQVVHRLIPRNIKRPYQLYASDAVLKSHRRLIS